MDKIDQLFKTLADYGNLQLQYTGGVSYSYYDEDFTLSVKTGEDSGGNCWGGNATYQPFNQQPQAFTMLESLILEIDPDFTLKNYKTIQSLVQFNETRKSEYYGNGNYYNEYTISKDDLVKSLSSMGINLNDSLATKIEDKFSNLYLAQMEPTQMGNKTKHKY
jgi:hypothetical protein